MTRTQPERDAASVFRKPVAPPPDHVAVRRGPEARGDRSLALPRSVSAALSRTVREQLAYLSRDQQRAFLWRYRARARSPLVAFLFLLLGWHYLYLRRRGLQVLFWATLGGLAVWWVADVFRVRRLVREHNRRVAMQVMRALWG